MSSLMGAQGTAEDADLAFIMAVTARYAFTHRMFKGVLHCCMCKKEGRSSDQNQQLRYTTVGTESVHQVHIREQVLYYMFTPVHRRSF